MDELVLLDELRRMRSTHLFSTIPIQTISRLHPREMSAKNLCISASHGILRNALISPSESQSSNIDDQLDTP
jgi:hypothetical protein